MRDSPQSIPAEQFDEHSPMRDDETDAVEILVREFGQEAGKRVGSTLAKEIRNDPEVRHAAATGAGIGLGIVVGFGLLAALSQ
jgi:tetrahydromethanopterin S-methyltransferase subunit G